MKEKKNIDRLFQEQLKDFEALPDPQIWSNIARELQKDKKKRNIIPIWFRYSGIAAALLLGLALYHNHSNSTLENNKNEVVANDNAIEKTDTVEKTDALDNTTNSIEKEHLAPIKKENKKGLLFTNKRQQRVVTNLKKNKKDEEYNTNIRPEKNNKNKNNSQKDSKIYLSKNNTPLDENVNTNHAEKLVANETITTSKKSDKDLIKNMHHQGKSLATVSKNEGKSTQVDNKKEIENGIKITIEDKSENNIEKPNELDEILKKKTSKESKLANADSKKWEVTPNVAPIYLNANSGGSPIDNDLSNNSKTGENSMSYGIGINYALNSKIAVRTGVNKVVLGYNTNDVYYTAGFATNAMANIKQNPNESIELKSSDSYNSLTLTEKEIQQTNLGNINQIMGYYELPLEVSYTVVNKKIGVNLIGGFSTLFLNENKISLVSPQTNTTLGEATNLNKIHISTNIGVGFKYKIMKSFQLNFEPMLKYQLNTFSKDDNNFQPLFIGLYSGISYQF